MSSRIPNQIPVWDSKHANGDHNILRNTPSPLAELSERHFPKHSRILELGCGVGRDAVFFAQHGHEVIATDGSTIVIEQNLKQIHLPEVEFKVVDIRGRLPYKDGMFEVVFANLSLHYYSSQQTEETFQEIGRILKPGGVIAFACKSYDSLHNDGKEIEPNVFISPTGVTIHLFSLPYSKSLIDGMFSVEHLDEIDEEFNGRHSRIIRCIARKPGH